MRDKLVWAVIVNVGTGFVIGLCGISILIWQNGWIALGAFLMLWGDNWGKEAARALKK